MNELERKIKAAIEAPKQRRALDLGEVIGKELGQEGQRNAANDLSSKIEAALKNGSKKDVPPPPAANLDGTEDKSKSINSDNQPEIKN